MENAPSCAVAAPSRLPRNKGIRSAYPLPSPRVWTGKQIAARFNRSQTWFYKHLPRLRQLGFPKRDPIVGGWDRVTVEAWLDRRAGVGDVANMESEMLEAIRGDC